MSLTYVSGVTFNNLAGVSLYAAWFEDISGTTTGTVSNVPAGGTITLDLFPGAVDAVVSTMSGGVPDFGVVKTGAGATVTTTFDTDGNYTLSGTPAVATYCVVYYYTIPIYLFDVSKSLVELEFTGTVGVSSLNGLVGAVTVAGTADQVLVSTAGATVTLSTPQDIGTTSIPLFGAVDSSGSFTANYSGTDTSSRGTGLFWDGSSGSDVGYVRVDPSSSAILELKAPTGAGALNVLFPDTGALSIDGSLIVSGGGTARLNQDLETSDNVVFEGLSLSTLGTAGGGIPIAAATTGLLSVSPNLQWDSANSVLDVTGEVATSDSVYVNRGQSSVSGNLKGVYFGGDLSDSDGYMRANSSGTGFEFKTASTPYEVSWIATDSFSFVFGPGTMAATGTCAINQDVRTTAEPVFERVGLSAIDSERIIQTNLSGKTTEANLSDHVAGTTNQVTVTDDGFGGIVLSLPQSIGTGNVPTFAGAILQTGFGTQLTIRHSSSLNNTQFLVDSGGNLSVTPSGGNVNVVGNLNASVGLDVTGDITVTGTVDGIDVAGTAVTTWGNGLEYTSGTAAVDYNTTNLKITLGELNTIQDIHTSAAVNFGTVSASSVTASTNLNGSYLTDGQICFPTSTRIGGDSNLFWDNANKRLGIRTSSPSHVQSIHCDDNAAVSLRRTTWNSGDFFENITAGSASFPFVAWQFYDDSAGTYTPGLSVTSLGRVGVGTNGPTTALDVTSTSTQFRLTHTANTVYANMTVDSSGNLYADPTGSTFLIRNSGATELFRMTFSGGISYLQCGQNSSDTGANMRICRTLTGSSNIDQFSVYSDDTFISGDLALGTGNSTRIASFAGGRGVLKYDSSNGVFSIETSSSKRFGVKTGGSSSYSIYTDENGQTGFNTSSLTEIVNVSDTTDSCYVRIEGITNVAGKYAGVKLREEPQSTDYGIDLSYDTNNNKFVLRGISNDIYDGDHIEVERVSGDTTFNGTVTVTGTTEAVEIIDSGSTGATEQDWIEVQVGGVTGYIRVYASK